MGEELETVDKRASCFGATLDAEDHHGPLSFGQVFFYQFLLVSVAARITNPLHRRMRSKMIGHGLGVFTVTLHAHGQGFNALHELPGIIR